jgi:hypothetical protein
MMIDKKTIQDFFRSNRERGAKLDGEMLWSFFFTDTAKSKFKTLKAALVADGYRYVDISGEKGDYTLHVERVETHTAASLHRRCIELDELATDYGVEDFEGFVVGNIDGSVMYRA